MARLSAFVAVSACCFGGGASDPTGVDPLPLPPWAPEAHTLASGYATPAASATLVLDPSTIVVSAQAPNDARTLAQGVYFVSATTGAVQRFAPAEPSLLDRLTSAELAARRESDLLWAAPYDSEPGIHRLGQDGSYVRLVATSGSDAFFFDGAGTTVAYGVFRGDATPAGPYLTVASLREGSASVTTPQIAEETMALVGEDDVLVNTGTGVALTTREGTETRVLEAGWRVVDAVPSPDGGRVVLTAGPLLEAPVAYVMDASGEHRRPLMAPATGAVWSHDGSAFATIARAGEGPASAVDVFDREGNSTSVIQLPPPNDPDEVLAPRHDGVTRIAWSPDGARLAMLVDSGGACVAPLNGGCDCDAHLYLVARDGTGLTRVTDWMMGCGTEIAW